MDETPDPDAGKSREEMIAELRRMQAAIRRADTENRRDAYRIREIKRQMRELEDEA